MKIYRAGSIAYIVHEDRVVKATDFSWNDLFRQEDPREFVQKSIDSGVAAEFDPLLDTSFLAPLDDQEIWAAGVTYFRSRDARMAESEKAGGGSFYDRVYDAERPELFYKGSKRTAVGHRENVRIRHDSAWNVPEPELTLAINSRGAIFGYTVGNDMSSRDIEGENPLYLPQAKVYDASCALGPCLLLADALRPETEISITIERNGEIVFEGTTKLAEMKRKPAELAGYLYRDNTFANGCYLLTGTGIVPAESFTLASGDVVSIGIVPIGTLLNTVE